jgi:hypothetical protein
MMTAGYLKAGVEVTVERKCMPDDNTGRITHWQRPVGYWQSGVTDLGTQWYSSDVSCEQAVRLGGWGMNCRLRIMQM